MNELKYQKDTPLLQLLAQLQAAECQHCEDRFCWRYWLYRRTRREGVRMKRALRLSHTVSNEFWNSAMASVGFNRHTQNVVNRHLRYQGPESQLQ